VCVRLCVHACVFEYVCSCVCCLSVVPGSTAWDPCLRMLEPQNTGNYQSVIFPRHIYLPFRDW